MSENSAAGSGSADALLSVRDLAVDYGVGPAAFHAVRGATFTLRRGERVGIVGESGSGKSTLTTAIAGLNTDPSVRITADELTFDGRPLDRRTRAGLPHRTPGLSMVFQDAMTSLDPVATIGSQFTAVFRGIRRVGGREARELAAEWLRKVGLTDTERVLANRPYELSGGMRQRVMVALALCSRPQILIADEPTSALDASVSRTMMDLLTDMTVELGAALLIVTHDIELVRHYTDRVIVMYRGRIVDDVASARLDTDARSPYTRALVGCVPTLSDHDRHRLQTLDAAFDPTLQEA
ncbi:ABC transporter ATP-binding protein [Kineococcus sp. SYSU DK003]|uniref:ABC transporter ATP-binding protein n=1 Tax=Kineococcus sp. SYSU DK003 TaxID=3383124 RepID=UPI003D7DECCA